jgi:hypothetical protein
MCLAARRLFERPHDHLLDLRVGDPARCAGPRLVMQPVQAIANEPAAPFTDRDLRHPQPPSHDPVVDPFGARQDTRSLLKNQTLGFDVYGLRSALLTQTNQASLAPPNNCSFVGLSGAQYGVNSYPSA